ncbi:MAG TPA: DUF523 and DUF1722 domain-containing protein [Methanomassiliicoccales archaeon]|nr:DUF523 and DUF1722 domain-containing protein [Methanomassiliicoccales archaeon]
MILPRPRVVISRCIEFEACRYDGAKIPSLFVLKLMPYVDLFPVCMEADIGLGVPRDPVRIVRKDGADHLIQPATGRDVTEEAVHFTHDHLSKLKNIDGFILKGRSPSCGIKDVRVYPPGEEKAPITSKGTGMFARNVMEDFSHLAVEDESRLLNERIADHFLTRIFTFARFRRSRETGRSRDLMDFHTRHKLLLMGYHQEALRRMGRIVASNTSMVERFQQYSEELYTALRRPPRCRSWNNVLMHAMGYFSDHLQPKEKAHFLQMLEWYGEGKVPLTAPMLLVRAWALHYDDPYLQEQVFFEPYPLEFMKLMGNDSCTGRELWEGVR